MTDKELTEHMWPKQSRKLLSEFLVRSSNDEIEDALKLASRFGFTMGEYLQELEDK